jgi:putative phosphoribosyl transferase
VSGGWRRREGRQVTRFRDRREAGQHLAARLADLGLDSPLVLALPRGGVPVAYEVARALHAPLDVLVVRKIGAPSQPELGVGAIAEGGEPLLDSRMLARLGRTPEDLAETVLRERTEVRRRVAAYRGDLPALAVEGRTVVVVDDGLATGSSARAALRSLRARGVARLVLAVPVCARETAARFADEADDVVCVLSPGDFRAVGAWYDRFDQTDDQEVVELLHRARATQQAVRLPVEEVTVGADLVVPPGARAIVVFAHGSGSGRGSPRNRRVAGALQEAGLATLLLDLLTAEEEQVDLRTRELRFDVALLAGRLVAAREWLGARADTRGLRPCYFGASTGAAAALIAAAREPEHIGAVVSRGGRPDLAGEALEHVRAPTLLLVGGEDHAVADLNRLALGRLGAAQRQMTIIPGATHLFEEPGALDEVARLAGDWFLSHLR